MMLKEYSNFQWTLPRRKFMPIQESLKKVLIY